MDLLSTDSNHSNLVFDTTQDKWQGGWEQQFWEWKRKNERGHKKAPILCLLLLVNSVVVAVVWLLLPAIIHGHIEEGQVCK